MKAHLKKTLIFLFLSAIFVPSHAQHFSTATFNYDDNGNRIIRCISFSKKIENGKNVENENSFLPKIEEVINEIQISVFPNPTQDKVNLTVENNPFNKPLHVLIASPTGQVLQQKTLTNRQDVFDLSGQSPGIYFLELISGEEKQVWKISKK